MSDISKSLENEKSMKEGVVNNKVSEQTPSVESSKGAEDDDSDFVVTAEAELDEEDSITPEEDIADGGEVDSLLQESEIPIEQLLARYGMTSNIEALSSEGSNKRSIDNSETEALPGKRKRIQRTEPISDGTQNLSEISENPKSTDMEEDKNPAPEESSDGSSSSTGEEDDEEPRNTCKELINQTSGAYNSDDDEDYVPNTETENSWKAEVRIGTEYQIEVDYTPSPELIQSNREFENRITSECSLLWDPSHLPESQVVDYERQYAAQIKSPLPTERTIDDEEALFHLTQSHYDTKEALHRMSLGENTRSHHFGNYVSTWSEQDCQAFERGFAMFNKDFRQIHLLKLKHRSVNEIVLFYYIWKKTARYDEFSKIHRKNKKKPVHPGLTDFMDCLTHEQELIAESIMGNGTEKSGPHQPKSSSLPPVVPPALLKCPNGDTSTSSPADNLTYPTSASSSSNGVSQSSNADGIEEEKTSAPSDLFGSENETNNNNNSVSNGSGTSQEMQIKSMLESSDDQQQQQHTPLII